MNKNSEKRPETAREWTLDVRIYYEDTDAAGIVYYANYLKFFERCRTEWIRAIGHDQSELAREHNIAFVVRAVALDYLAPARLDDRLEISLAVEKLGAAQAVFRQHARRVDPQGVADLVSGTVQVVCVNLATMKASPIPRWLRDKLEQLQ